MRRRKLLFVEQAGVYVILIHIVRRPVIHGFLFVIRAGKDQRHAFHLFLVDYIGLLGEQFRAVRLQTHTVGIGKIMVFRSLSARTVLMQIAHAILGDIMVQFMIPTVHQVHLLSQGSVQKAVVVSVVLHLVIRIMYQQTGRHLVVYMPGGIGIPFIATGIATEEVDGKDIGRRRFLKFHIDLSGQCFVAVLDRRCSFRDLDTFHPGAGHVIQAIQRGGSPEVRVILRQHLHIGSGKPQQFDLAGSGSGIRIGDIDRRVCLEALR